jgi:type II restriction enzyme
MPLPSHIRSAADLVTPRSEIRAGFIKMALEKSKRATPYLSAARALRARALHLGIPAALITDEEAREALLSAAGLSAKALQHLSEDDKTTAITEFVSEYIEPAGEDFADELTYRFLLTHGDALGGEMRNVAGRLADIRFLAAVLGSLAIRSITPQWRHKDTKTWTAVTDAREAARNGCGLAWTHKGQPRTLLFNVRVPQVKNKNVDSVLLMCDPDQACARRDPYTRNPVFYAALGELKGGIDPAGADEHWKTARSTLDRINEAFARAGLNPNRYFVGAAIVTAMADEIFGRLQSGLLSNAANLTSDDQLASFCEWLVDL